MGVIDIPFTQGQHEGIDAKLLPQGLFSSLVNTRYLKDGRLGARNGYRKDATTGAPTPGNVVLTQAIGPQHLVTVEQAGSTFTERRRSPSGYETISQLTVSNPLGTVAPQIASVTRYRTGAGAYAQGQFADSSDIAYIGGYLWVGVTVSGLDFKVFQVNPTTGGIVAYFQNADVVDASNVKLVLLGTTLMVFYAKPSTQQIKLMTLNTSTASVITSAAVVVTPGSPNYPSFDASPGGSATEAYLIFQNSAVALSFGTVNAAGAYSALSTVAIANNARASICPHGAAPADQVAITLNEGLSTSTQTNYYAIYRRSTTSFLVAKTAQATGGGVVANIPTIGQVGASSWVTFVTWAGGTAPIVARAYDIALPGTVTSAQGLQATSRPVSLSGAPVHLASDRYEIGAMAADSGGYGIVRVDQIDGSMRTLATCSQDEAVPQQINAFQDPRRNLVTLPASGIDPGLSALATAMPQQALNWAGWDVIRFEYGQRNRCSKGVNINNTTLLSGAVIAAYDAQRIGYASFLTRPRLSASALSYSGAGTELAAGTYQYVFIHEGYDAHGNRFQSAPSLPISITLSVAGRITIAADALANGGLSAGFAGGLHIFRTEADGDIFYSTIAIASYGSGTLTDTLADSVLIANEVLYTQGQRGGLSGVHEFDPIPAASFLWAGPERVIMGGLEIANMVQWTMVATTGEILPCANDPQWQAIVDGAVTAVAELDGISIIGTQDAIWTVSGDGPDDTGSGSFAAPVKLPSTIGIISQKSLQLAGPGLFFQGAPDLMYLMPRGGGEPQWIGKPVRDTMAAFPYCADSAFDKDSGRIYWAMTDTGATAGRLLVYDTRTSSWSVDNVQNRAIKTLAVYNGQLVVDGSIVEATASYQDDDGATQASVIPTLVTGDIRAFGLQGWGQYIRDTLFGELRDATTNWVLTQDVSYDSGKTWTDSSTWQRSDLAASVGDAISGAEHMFLVQRTDSVRLRWSWTTPTPTEGMVFHSVSIEANQTGGLKRQPNARRAA